MQHGKFKRALGFFPITDIQLKVAYEVYKLSNVFILTLYIHYIIIIMIINWALRNLCKSQTKQLNSNRNEALFWSTTTL